MTNLITQGMNRTPQPATSQEPGGGTPTNSAADPWLQALVLLTAMWPDPELIHQVASRNPKTGEFRNVTAASISEAVELSRSAANQGLDSYFACAEYSKPGSRAAQNVAQARGLWLDIDCGETKAARGEGYPHAQAAQSELTAFCHRVGLPSPTHVIDSGSGLHIYWVLDESLPRPDWQNAAAKLKALAKDCGFLADPTRTADIASVLRIPGTQNFKYTPPRPVRLLPSSRQPVSRDELVQAISRAHDAMQSRTTGLVASPVKDRAARETTYGPPDLNRLRSALSVLDPDCSDSEWKLYRLAPLAREARSHPELLDDLYQLAKDWSRGALREQPSEKWSRAGTNGQSGEKVFDREWNRFLSKESSGQVVTLGSIYHDAKERGWRFEEFEVVGSDLRGNAQGTPVGPSSNAVPPAQPAQRRSIPKAQLDLSEGVLIPRPTENPVVGALKQRGLYKGVLSSGRHQVTCPWADEHGGQQEVKATYAESDERYPLGRFCCPQHVETRSTTELLEVLGISANQARNRPQIRVIPGELHGVVRAAERILADEGGFYQAGGLISAVSVDPMSGDSKIQPQTVQGLTSTLAHRVDWRCPRNSAWATTDPPERHVRILHELPTFHHLQPLAGLARQPYFRESDGVLVTSPGYDSISRRFGVFRPEAYALPQPTRRAAEEALRTLVELLDGFSFASEQDRAAALSAIFTAVVRTTLPLAPGFHMRAPVMGSGKTYLSELIASFAGPGQSSKISYPKTSEEATKVILAALLPGPAVIEFDDMDSDWMPHSVVKRMFTAPEITERILGMSKTATVSTRTLFLGSGNNVGPTRDLLRRVLTVNLDPRCAIPALKQYKGDPVATVRADRERYVAAVLTIILAWRAEGKPRVAVPSIASFGEWTEYCRCPLIWLGQPDPASGLFEQLRSDPDVQDLSQLMSAWKRVFGSVPTTTRRVVQETAADLHLRDAIDELPVTDGGKVNPNKLGWYLRKHAGRIIDDMEFRQLRVDGRNGWALVPAFGSSVKTVASARPSPSEPRETSTPILDEISF